MRSNYDPTEQENMLKSIGETMMDFAAKEKDHKKANDMCVIGQDLSLIGTLFAKKMHEYNEYEVGLISEVSDAMGLTKDGQLV